MKDAQHRALVLFNAVVAHEPYFVQRRDADKKLGHSSLQKMIAALRMLAYGVSGDFMDEYLRIAENTATRCLQYFGSHNDINVLEHSSLFIELAGGLAPSVNYSINDNDYTMGYYLADSIYHSWSTFVETIHAPQGNKREHFAKTQESVRKDVERAFEVLQAGFAIVRGAVRSFDHEMLKTIMITCIILHNMIVEDE
ncbi:uncharacterized protein LOC133873263 [Alnus glutinosa]|uniref:uncharacterized protein LOC133873263 n=1 Tax=Alnus glutinosa TaxID=3517 RepID=UPI002D7958D0|nr:uncharacterized protein LOC133873263 [Alnus glutinosa]